MSIWTRWSCLGLMLVALSGCAKTPSPTAEITDEEDQRIEEALKRRVEREGEGSTRRAAEGKKKTQPSNAEEPKKR